MISVDYCFGVAVETTNATAGTPKEEPQGVLPPPDQSLRTPRGRGKYLQRVMDMAASETRRTVPVVPLVVHRRSRGSRADAWTERVVRDIIDSFHGQ